MNFNEDKEYKQRETLTINEIREMRTFADFQSHSLTHPCLSKCANEKSWFEITHSKKLLESYLNNKCDYYDYW